MAIDTLARGLAVSNSGGGGGGSLDVGIEEGVGIKITGTDPKKISNDGVTNITESDGTAQNGTIKVILANKAEPNNEKHIAVKGLSDGAFMQKETSIPATASATDTKFPTSKAVATALGDKIDNSKKGVANGVATLDANAKLTSTQLPDHNHASNKINAMTDYTKPNTTSAIDASTDTLNSAIGKLEKALDGKQASGTYATGDSSGNAVTANKLANTAAIGSVTKGVYFKADGTPATMTYELNKTVPSDAIFTDTTYTADNDVGVVVNNTTNKITNSGVRKFLNSEDTDSNGTFRANVNGVSTLVSVKGLSNAAYKGVEEQTLTPISANLPTSKAVSSYVTSAINGLDVDGTQTFGAGKTISKWSETDGKVSITSQDISITKSQVSDFPTSMTPTAHNQASSTINEMKSYAKPTTAPTTGIAASDTLNTAIGKLEYKSDKNETNISKIVKTLRPDADMFVSDETAVSTKVVPQYVDKFAVVSTISGRTVKNIWDEQYFRGTWDSADGSKKEVSSTSANVASLNYIAVDENKTYSSTVEIKVCCYTSSKSYIGNIANAKTFKPLANTAYITFNTYGSSYGETGYHNDISLYEGSISNAEYKKLYSAPIESVVSESKNLLDWSKTVKGELTKGTVKDGVNIISDYIPVSDGISYTVSSNINMSNYEISWYTDGKTYIDRSYPSGTTFTATAPTNAAYARCEFASNTTWAKVEKGSTATTYSPYFKTTISVPNEARNCVGYGLGIGDICNEIDFENKVYTQNVAEVDLGDYTYNHDTAKKYFYFALSNAKKPANNDTVPNIICAKYNTVATNAIATAESTTNGITISASGNVIIKDLSNDDKTAAEFKEFVSGVKLVYELATPSTTNLSDIIPPIRVESGGTITLENAHNLDVANTIIYKKEVLA